MALNCTLCPAGAACADAAASPVSCLPGTFSDAGARACTACPPGYACPSTISTASLEVCANGTYSVGSQTNCTACPAGYACPSTKQAAFHQCAPGTYSLEGQDQCQICPAGYACPLTTTEPVACLSGTFSSGGALSCRACPAGSYCPDTASDSVLPCPPGSYSISSQVQCTVRIRRMGFGGGDDERPWYPTYPSLRSSFDRHVQAAMPAPLPLVTVVKLAQYGK